MHLQLARRGGGVDPLGQRHKRHAQGLEFVKQRHEVLERPAQSIQPPTDQDIEPPPLDTLQESIEGGSTVASPRDALVDEFGRGPAPCSNVPAEFDELGAYARGLGFVHVESAPLVRSSYHAEAAPVVQRA